ncbi:unnamed protein product [Pedinophyceae sp. YPF-701]|nr:unnamed protein product [Pedinophyceae sp. YPF-701]
MSPPSDSWQDRLAAILDSSRRHLGAAPTPQTNGLGASPGAGNGLPPSWESPPPAHSAAPATKALQIVPSVRDSLSREDTRRHKQELTDLLHAVQGTLSELRVESEAARAIARDAANAMRGSTREVLREQSGMAEVETRLAQLESSAAQGDQRLARALATVQEAASRLQVLEASLGDVDGSLAQVEAAVGARAGAAERRAGEAAKAAQAASSEIEALRAGLRDASDGTQRALREAGAQVRAIESRAVALERLTQGMDARTSEHATQLAAAARAVTELRAWQSEVTHTLTTVRALEARLESLDGRITDPATLARQVADVEATVLRRADERLASRAAELESALRRVAEAQEREAGSAAAAVGALRPRVDAAVAEAGRAVAAAEAVERELASRLPSGGAPAASREEVRELAAKVREAWGLKEELRGLKREVDAVVAAKEDTSSVENALKGAAELRTRLASVEARLETASSMVAESGAAATKLPGLEAQQKALVREVAELQERMTALSSRQDKAAAAAAAAAANAPVASVPDKKAVAQQISAALTEAMHGEMRERKALEARLAENASAVEKARSAAEARAAEFDRIVDTIHENMETMYQNMTYLEEQIEAARTSGAASAKGAKKPAGGDPGDLADARQQIRRLRGAVDGLQGQAAVSDANISAFKAALESVEARAGSIEESHVALQRELAALKIAGGSGGGLAGGDPQATREVLEPLLRAVQDESFAAIETLKQGQANLTAHGARRDQDLRALRATVARLEAGREDIVRIEQLQQRLESVQAQIDGLRGSRGADAGASAHARGGAVPGSATAAEVEALRSENRALRAAVNGLLRDAGKPPLAAPPPAERTPVASPSLRGLQPLGSAGGAPAAVPLQSVESPGDVTALADPAAGAVTSPGASRAEQASRKSLGDSLDDLIMSTGSEHLDPPGSAQRTTSGVQMAFGFEDEGEPAAEAAAERSTGSRDEPLSPYLSSIPVGPAGAAEDNPAAAGAGAPPLPASSMPRGVDVSGVNDSSLMLDVGPRGAGGDAEEVPQMQRGRANGADAGSGDEDASARGAGAAAQRGAFGSPMKPQSAAASGSGSLSSDGVLEIDEIGDAEEEAAPVEADSGIGAGLMHNPMFDGGAGGAPAMATARSLELSSLSGMSYGGASPGGKTAGEDSTPTSAQKKPAASPPRRPPIGRFDMFADDGGGVDEGASSDEDSAPSQGAFGQSDSEDDPAELSANMEEVRARLADKGLDEFERGVLQDTLQDLNRRSSRQSRRAPSESTGPANSERKEVRPIDLFGASDPIDDSDSDASLEAAFRMQPGQPTPPTSAPPHNTDTDAPGDAGSDALVGYADDNDGWSSSVDAQELEEELADLDAQLGRGDLDEFQLSMLQEARQDVQNKLDAVRRAT